MQNTYSTTTALDAGVADVTEETSETRPVPFKIFEPQQREDPTLFYRRAVDELLDERKKWERALSDLKCANVLLRRALEEAKNPELRLNAVMASPTIDAILEQIEKTGVFTLAANSTKEEHELVSELFRLGKLRLKGKASLTDAGRAMLRDWE